MSQPPAPGDDQGAEPGRDEGLPGDAAGAAGEAGGGGGGVRDPRLPGFAPGGAWHGHAPGPELAAVLAAVCGPEWRCPGAEPGELIGVLRRWSAVESWAAAAKLGVIRELIRHDDLPFLDQPRRRGLPRAWSDSLAHEVALALASSVQSADKVMQAAVELESRLPGTGRLLAGGALTLPKARLIAEMFQDLSDEDAARAEEMLLPQLTGPAGKTFGQVERLAAGIAAEVDPGLAERQRAAAERHRSRVEMFRERAGTAALSGRDLPTDETLAAYANVNTRAGEYKESGAFPDTRLDRLRTMAYLDLLNGVTADARVAHALATAEAEAEADADTVADAGTGDKPGAGQARPGGWPGPCDPRDCSCGERDGCGGDPDEDGPDDYDGPDDSQPDPGGGGAGDNGPRDDDRAGDPGDSDPGGQGDSGHGGSARDDDDEPGGTGPDNSGSGDGCTGDGDPGGQDPDAGPLGRPAAADLVIPLLTLLGLAQRPGEGHGLGPLDPALCRDLAATAARWPASRWCLTITDPAGIAIGHGCARPAVPGRPGPAARTTRGRPHDPRHGPPAMSLAALSLAALPARVNLTIPLPALEALRRLARPPAPWGFAPRGGRGDPAPAGGYGTWVLTLPGGRDFTVAPEPVPAHACDHRHESHAYQPNGTLRHLVQVRDGECTFPPCSRHARESDFEHAVPYDQGGRTCACNAGACSRRCHRVKQSPGWTLSQPRPAWHQWTTPAGWTYSQGPKRYPA